MKSKYLFSLLYILFPFLLFSQQEKRANVWHFGDNIGLDFNTNPPTQINSAFNGFQDKGSATICDTLGQLLFYTNGETIWNRNNEVMEGGANLGGNSSVSQSSIIVPSPAAPHLYYVFYLNENFPTFFPERRGQFYYALVDVRENNGLGAVTSLNNQIHTGCSEQLAVIRHCNKKDYWIIVHELGNNRFVVWSLTEEGVSPQPTIIAIGSGAARIGEMVASPLGNKLALGFPGTFSGAEILDFDPETGNISQPVWFTDFRLRLSSGFAFSPNGKRLYITSFIDSLLLQINLDLPTIPEIKASVTTIAKTAHSYGSIQNAPDGKLYTVPNLHENLAAVHHPNEIGLACNFEEDVIPTGSRYNGSSLPNFISIYFKERDTIEVIEARQDCEGNRELEAITTVAGDSVVYEWYYERQLLPNSNTTKIQIDNNGAYSFKALVYTDCKTVLKEFSSSTIVELPDILPLRVDSINTTVASCEEANASLRVFSSGGQGTIQFSIDDTIFQPTAKFIDLKGGHYSVIVMDEEDCIHTDDLFIPTIPSPRVSYIQTDPTPCGKEEGRAAIEVVGGLGTISASIGDSFVESDYTFENLSGGDHQLFLTDEEGCTIDTMITVLQLNCTFYIPNAFSPNGDGINDQFQIYPHSDYLGEFKWLRIYDRWGNLVFETATPDQQETAWDGTYKNKKVASGVYFYYVEVLIDGREEIIGGSLNLL